MNMLYDSIVVGAGPAGITAAIYLRRANKRVLVLDGNGYGGELKNVKVIENYPGFTSITGSELADNMYKQANTLGVEFKSERVLNITSDKTVLTEKDSYKAKSIIIATGRTRKFELDKDDYYLGKGLSYCATCDGNFFKNKIVAVLGEGASAIEDALYLSNIVSKVYLISDKDNTIDIDKTNIEVLYNTTVIKINGETLIESVDIKDSDGLKTIPINGLFVANGQVPNNMFKNIIDVSESGYFDSTDFPRTKVKGIYVAGDCVDKKLKQVVTAVSDGAVAATYAIKEMED